MAPSVRCCTHTHKVHGMDPQDPHMGTGPTMEAVPRVPVVKRQRQGGPRSCWPASSTESVSSRLETDLLSENKTEYLRTELNVDTHTHYKHL